MIFQCISNLAGSLPNYCGDVATWVTGFATVALFAATFLLFVVGSIQIQTERKARIENERHAITAEIRSQAALISAWIVAQGIGPLMEYSEIKEDTVAWAAIRNQSTQPIYQVIVSIVAVPETGRGSYRGGPSSSDQVCIDVVPPGQGYTMIPAHYGGMHRRPGVEIAFQDGAGRSWVRTAMGELSEIEETTVEHYQIMLPANWQSISIEPPTDEEVGRMPSESGDSRPSE